MGLLGAPGLSRVGPFLSQGLIRETFTRVKRTVLTQEYILPVNGHTCGEPPQRFFSGLVKKSLFSLAKSMFLGSEPFRGRLSLGFEAATKQQPVSSQQQPANSPAAAGQQPAASHSTSSPPPGRQQPANQEQPASSQQPASNQSAAVRQQRASNSVCIDRIPCILWVQQHVHR